MKERDRQTNRVRAREIDTHIRTERDTEGERQIVSAIFWGMHYLQ